MKESIKTVHVIIGCGSAAFLAVAIISALFYFGGAAFLKFGIDSDLTAYRDAIRQIDMDGATRTGVMDDLEHVRLSLRQKNHFGFFQWVNLDESMQRIIGDGILETGELAELDALILQMKRTQGIPSQAEAELEEGLEKPESGR